MIIEQFHYKVEGFGPRLDNPTRPGSWEFSIKLDKTFARKALETPLSDMGYKNLQKYAEKTIKAAGLAQPDERIRTPYDFVSTGEKNNKIITCLLQCCHVPGNACLLSASYNDIESLKKQQSFNNNYLSFNPHNIDTPRQAGVLLANWITWQAHIASFLELDYTEM